MMNRFKNVDLLQQIILRKFVKFCNKFYWSKFVTVGTYYLRGESSARALAPRAVFNALHYAPL